MKKFSLFFFSISVSLIFIFQGCHCPGKTVSTSPPPAASQAGQNPVPVTPPIPAIIIDKNFTGDSLGAKFSVDTAFVSKENILEIRVKYSGGCREHNFNLYTSKAYMKSMPPQLKLFLTHDNHSDHCRDLISQNLYFDISGARYEGQNKLLLIIHGYHGKIEYIY